MTTSDHIRALIRSFVKRNDSAFITAVHYLIAEEREKGHCLLARDLEKILANGNVSNYETTIYKDLPQDKERGLPLVEIQKSELDWVRIVLSPEIEHILKNIVTEFHKRDVFRSYGIKPKQKLLFFGPPGCGKTLASRVVAGVLGLPIVYVRFDSVVSSYLGETAANLRRVFDFIQRGNWVVLFDEFDAIGKSRDNAFEHGELKRVVNSLLQLMDAFTGDSLLIAATNHESLLDYAIWRRFDEICYFDYPTVKERESILKLFLSGVSHNRVDTTRFAMKLKRMSGGDIERICLDAIKSSILLGRREVDTEDLNIGLKNQRKRIKLSNLPPNNHKRGKEKDGEKS